MYAAVVGQDSLHTKTRLSGSSGLNLGIGIWSEAGRALNDVMIMTLISECIFSTTMATGSSISPNQGRLQTHRSKPNSSNDAPKDKLNVPSDSRNTSGSRRSRSRGRSPSRSRDRYIRPGLRTLNSSSRRRRQNPNPGSRNRRRRPQRIPRENHHPGPGSSRHSSIRNTPRGHRQRLIRDIIGPEHGTSNAWIICPSSAD